MSKPRIRRGAFTPPHQFPQSTSVYLHEPETNLPLPPFPPDFPFSEVKYGNTCWHRYTSKFGVHKSSSELPPSPTPALGFRGALSGAWTDDLSLHCRISFLSFTYYFLSYVLIWLRHKLYSQVLTHCKGQDEICVCPHPGEISSLFTLVMHLLLQFWVAELILCVSAKRDPAPSRFSMPCNAQWWILPLFLPKLMTQ